MGDFDKYGEMDVLRIFDNNSLGSYYKFLVKYEKEYTIRLSEAEEKVIEFVSKKLASGKRIHELEMLKRLLKYQHGIMTQLKKSLHENYNCSMDDDCAENVVNMMTNEFPTSAAKKTYSQCVFLEKEGSDYSMSQSFGEMLQNEDFYNILEELIDFGISRYKENFSMRYQDTDLVLYQKYTYEDACRLLNWERNEVPLNIGGYVCVLFSLIWGVFCVLIVKIIHPLIYKVLTMIPLVLGIVVMACLAVGLLADLYVTASGILKMNRRLEAMEKIAAELKELSDKVGENIYENVMEGMEFREEKKARIEELKEKYEEMAENRTKVGERLVKAFPKMQVRQHKEIFEELRERVRRRK